MIHIKDLSLNTFTGRTHHLPCPMVNIQSFEKLESNASLTVANDEINSHDGKCELSEIFLLYGEEYRENHNLTPHQLKTMNDIEKCRTFELGYHIDKCDNCGYTEVLANSCGNRHCPKCQSSKRLKWVESRVTQLLPVSYYHIVFTLPDKIFPLNLYNQELIYNLLFKSASDTLKEFGSDPKWLGGELGFYGILHTWSQTLLSHPHIHFVVSSGGINEYGDWIWPKYRDKFLFPVYGLSKVFRGKFIEGLEKAYINGELFFPKELEHLSCEESFNNRVKELRKTDWVVYSKRPFSGPDEVVKYISRYTHRTAISTSRIVSLLEGKVKFSYKNNKRDKECKGVTLWEEMDLEVEEFIRRFLYHVLPSGYHRIRYYGFLSNGNRIKREEALESLLFDEERSLEDLQIESYNGIICPECKAGKMETVILVNSKGHIVIGYEEIKNIKV